MNQNINKNIKVIVGLSGGVDSSVAALLLKQQGYAVSAVFMQNWEVENDDPFCQAEQDLSDARSVCDRLDIPLHVVNFTKEYWHEVFQYCLDEFNRGRTPNPDILCNQKIKFKTFLDYALASGARYVATGHYAQVRQIDNQYQLLQGKDLDKDQSYFLYTATQHSLAHCLFPLAEMTKPIVRQIAEQNELMTYNKKGSTGICFIGERHFKTFLREFLLPKPGLIKTPEGQILGEHEGLMYYTIGQRKGIQMGGIKNAAESPWYVLDKNMDDNTLIIGQGHDHPMLFRSSLSCQQLHWISSQPPQLPLFCTAKIRYRQTSQLCKLVAIDNHTYQVDFDQPQRAITPGQSIVFYQDNICLGGAIIIS